MELVQLVILMFSHISAVMGESTIYFSLLFFLIFGSALFKIRKLINLNMVGSKTGKALFCTNAIIPNSANVMIFLSK